MDSRAEGAWPVVSKPDRPFVVAAHEASRRLGLPFEVAKEALRHAIRNMEVVVYTPVTSDGETSYVEILDYSIDVKHEPDSVVDAASFETWLIDRQPIRYEQFPTKMIGGNEARSLIEKAAGYDREAAEQWLRRKIRVGCFLALQGAHDLWLEGMKTDTRPVTFVEIDAGISLDALSVAKEGLIEVLAVEFAVSQPSPDWPRSLIAGAIARAEIQKALRYDAEAALAWLKSKIGQGVIRADAGSHDVVYHENDPSEEARSAFFNLEKPITTSSIQGNESFDWSTISVDRQDLEQTLAAESTESGQPADAQVAQAVEGGTKNERNAGRKPHKSFGPIMAVAGAWLEDRDYSIGDELTDAVLTELRREMAEFAQHLEDEGACLGNSNESKAPSAETIRKWSHAAIEAHRGWRRFRKPPRN